MIEQMVQTSKEPELITAVTRDHMIQETLSALGAFTMNPDELESWVGRAVACSPTKYIVTILKKRLEENSVIS